MIEISAFDATYARIRNVQDGAARTSTFLRGLQRRQAFVRLLESGQSSHGLEWERVPAFIAHCTACGIPTHRRGQG